MLLEVSSIRGDLFHEGNFSKRNYRKKKRNLIPVLLPVITSSQQLASLTKLLIV